MPDGTVLVAGGFGDGWLRSAELYDPARGRWTRVAPMTTAREHASATLLGNGRVLVAGGGRPSALRSAELYDPASGKWSPTGSMTGYGGTAALLRDGRVLVVVAAAGTGDVYSSATGTWTATGPRDLLTSVPTKRRALSFPLVASADTQNTVARSEASPKTCPQ